MNSGRIDEQAEALAIEGRIGEAVRLLKSAAAQGDADADFTIALWALTGQYIRRDLALSREYFRRAGAAGLTDSQAIYIALLANGTGGDRDWPQAMRLLQALANDDAGAARQAGLIAAMKIDSNGDPLAVPTGHVLSNSPEIRCFPAFFSPAECAYLNGAAEAHFVQSTVVDPASGQLVQHPVRTSEIAAFPLIEEDPAIHALNRRIAAASRTTPQQGEPLQILRYWPGQEYKPHNDALQGADNQRVLTMLVYLNDDYEGGETYFSSPNIGIRGKVGDGILFRNADAAGKADASALHAGRPVSRGTKLVASRWIRARPLDLSHPAA